MPRTVRARRHRIRLVLAGGLLAAMSIAASGSAFATPPVEPPDADGRCDTFPTSYPGDGVPVPDDASCAVVMTASGVPVAEVWAWGDDVGLHWYNYLAQGYTPGDGSLLTMCATENSEAAGVEYECSTDSHDLLFTTANLFVAWPSSIDADHHFCESIDVLGLDGLPVASYACGTLANPSEGDGAAAPPPPSTPPPSSPPAATSPPVEDSTTAPTGPVDEPEVTDPTASQPVAPPGEPRPPTDLPTTVASSGSDRADPNQLPGDGPRPVATPVDFQSVGLVGGGAFPVAVVLVLAGLLALGGVTVLAGPSVLAARRRRTSTL